MLFDVNTVFYKKAKQVLDEYVRSGGDVNNLGVHDSIYKYIKNQSLVDENGDSIDLEKRFELLGHPRKRKKSKDVRVDLLREINEYLASGKSFHVLRKKLPFFEKLSKYSERLKSQGIELTHEQIMKQDLGFREYSDSYYKWKNIDKLKEYRNENGFIDSYRQDSKYNNFIKDLADNMNVPYYIVITLLAGEKSSFYYMNLDKVKYTKALLEDYAKREGTFVGIKRNNPTVYSALDYLTDYYSDGFGNTFSKKEWLRVFGLGDVENRFSDKKEPGLINISEIMQNLKEQFGNERFYCKDLDHVIYGRIIRKSVQMGIPVSELFKSYGLNVEGKNNERLAQVKVTKIPYLAEMKRRRDEILNEKLTPGMCNEEIFEAKIYAVKKVYAEYKTKLENYLPTNFEDEFISEVISEI